MMMSKIAFLVVALLPFAFARPTIRTQAVVFDSSFSEYVKNFAPLFALNDPNGVYKGSKSVLGEEINVVVDVTSNSTMSVLFTGPLTLNCTNEAYIYTASSGVITLPDSTKAGDCIHDALQANSVTLESIKYDSAADTVTIDAKYTFLSLSFLLTHQSLHAERAVVVPEYNNIRELFDDLFTKYALRDPFGNYHANQNIFGLTITSSLHLDGSKFNFSIDAPIEVSCADEAYTLSGSDITVTNFGQPNDCMTGLSNTYDITLRGLVYNAAQDTIEADVAFAGIPITLTYSHQAVIMKSEASFNTPKQFADEVRARAHANVLTDPSGQYHGSKSVLGQHVDTTMTINGDGTLNFVVSGVVSINCSNEAYTFANNDINLTNLNTAGDCVHDALQANSVSMTSIVYDSSANKVTVTLKYSLISISLDLDHVNALTVAPLTLRELVPLRFHHFALNDPAGKYYGTKTVLGLEFKITADIVSSSAFNLYVEGAIPVSCTNEAYTYSNGVISLPNVNNAGDCVHDALAKKDATFQSASYDAASDSITLVLKALINVSIVLNHVN